MATPQLEQARLPDRLWTELYFQSVHDSSVAPPGTHTMSIFAQYVPYAFADGRAGTTIVQLPERWLWTRWQDTAPTCLTQ